METIKALIGYERSQKVTMAFRKNGIDCYSCDVVECSGGYPEYHIINDFLDALYSEVWDFIGIHPPCTYLAVSGNRWYAKSKEREESIKYTNEVWKKVVKVAKYDYMENLVGVLGTPTQYIQPWMFGHGETKKTGLWLWNLPKLVPSDIVCGRENRIWKMAPGIERNVMRSETYQDIADAMGDQWSKIIKNGY